MRTAKILVAEDHPETAAGLARLLELAGHHVVLAQSYHAALDAARHDRFDVLLSDIALRDGDGCNLLPEIRKIYPIEGIAISGYGSPKDVHRCLEAGYSRHLIKPVMPDQIERALADLIDQFPDPKSDS
jgi:CheY-like chemotaxis protein